MRAMVIREFGGPEVFEAREVGEPEIRPDEVLVEVHATSINPVDIGVRKSGLWSGIVPPAIIGYDASGVVTAVGDAVRDITVGEEVFYTPEITASQPGTYAEYHAIPAALVAAKPVNLSHTEAASIPLAGATAWEALVLKAKVRVGESVLIHGAGGVGSLAIQIAKAAGAYVIAVCSDYMVDTARDLGADRVVDYKSEDFVDVVKKSTDNYGVDVVLDTVGGDTVTRSIEVTKALGRIVGVVRTNAGLGGAFPKNLVFYPSLLQRARFELDALRVLIERGQLRPVIDSVMPLTAVAEAHRRLERGGVKGKIVLSVIES